jgi:hypothetical protein
MSRSFYEDHWEDWSPIQDFCPVYRHPDLYGVIWDWAKSAMGNYDLTLGKLHCLYHLWEESERYMNEWEEDVRNNDIYGSPTLAATTVYLRKIILRVLRRGYFSMRSIDLERFYEAIDNVTDVYCTSEQTTDLVLAACRIIEGLYFNAAQK